jgi:D-psicose/D-tagatose/L-ribulose 3-epimerase
MTNLLGVSEIAWPQGVDERASEILARFNFRNVDLIPRRYLDDSGRISSEKVSNKKRLLRSLGLSAVSMQSLFFQNNSNLLGTPAEFIQFAKHAEVVLDLAQEFQAQCLIFGSPKNRIPQTGCCDSEIFEIAVDRVRSIGVAAMSRGIVFCVEPVPSQYGGRFLTNTNDAMNFIRVVAHENVKINLDLGVCLLEGSDFLKIIRSFGNMIGHIHYSSPNLGPPINIDAAYVSMISNADSSFASSIEYLSNDPIADLYRVCCAFTRVITPQVGDPTVG